MSSLKCRCTSCDQIVSDWIQDKCIQCYYNSISEPLEMCIRALHEGHRLNEIAWRAEVATYRGMIDDKNLIIYSYKNRFIIKAYDWIAFYVHMAIQFFRLLSIGGLGGFKNIIPRLKKHH